MTVFKTGLSVDNFQLLSTSLGVQVLVVVSGTSPDVPNNHTWNDDVQSLVLGSSENVEHRVVQVTLQWLGSERGNSVGVDVFLVWGTHVAPPSHVSLWSSASHFS